MSDSELVDQTLECSELKVPQSQQLIDVVPLTIDLSEAYRVLIKAYLRLNTRFATSLVSSELSFSQLDSDTLVGK